MLVCFDYAPTGEEPIIIRFEAEVITDKVDLDVVNTASHDNDALNTDFEESNEAVFHIGTRAVDDFYVTDLNVALEVEAPGVMENDEPGHSDDDVFVDVKTQPENGTLVLNRDGSFIYTPNPGFFGIDTFEYYFISTPGAATQGNYVDWATVTITVKGLDYFLPLISR